VTDTLRIGLVGSGWIMDHHARGVLAHPRAELVAATNWRAPSLDRLAHAHGIERRTTHWEDLVGDAGVDAVVIGTPNALHAPQAIAFLRAGQHVLVEKPMALDGAQAAAIVAAAGSSGARLMVAHCWRFHPDVIALRDRIAAGELGEIVKTRGYGVHPGWGPSGWFTQRGLAGGGALVDMGVHAIDTARFLLGDPEPRRVCAAIGTRYGSYDVDDDGILLISWSNGTNSVVESGWWQPHAAGMEAETEVYGTAGFARIFATAQPPNADYEHCPQSMYSAQMAEFVDAVADGRAPRPDGADGAVVMRVVDQAYRSSAAVAS
jgi:predicted dehydrogenase